MFCEQCISFAVQYDSAGTSSKLKTMKMSERNCPKRTEKKVCLTFLPSMGKCELRNGRRAIRILFSVMRH
jgi:hypothetical protein